MTGASARAAAAEVDASIRRAFFYAGFADKYDGAVHATRLEIRDAGDERAVGGDGDRLPGRGAAAGLRLARHAGDRDGQLRRRGSVGARIRSARPTSIRCSTRPTFPAASSTSSPARRTRSPRRSPSTTASTRSGTSATRPARPRSRPLRPATSRRPGRNASQVDWPRAEGREFLRRATQVKAIWTPYGE